MDMQDGEGDAVLEVRDLWFAYPSMPEALRGVTLGFRRGSKIALVGPNGAGKTTLLLMLNGMLRPDRGAVLLNGAPIGYGARDLRGVRQTVGLVFQNADMQVFAPTVYQDVAFGPLNLGVGGEELDAVVERALFDVGLTGYEKRPPHHLSGGEKKRVAIAGVLAMDPEVLVFDEPTASLDPAGAGEIMDLLDELNQEGRTIILSTHDVELAYRWADEIVIMHNGEVLTTGSPAVVLGDGDLLATAHLKPPTVIDLHRQLVRRGIVPAGTAPVGILPLLDQLEQQLGGDASRRQGTVFLCDAEGLTDDGIARITAAYGITSIGAMGSKAKRHLCCHRTEPDITHGVIDRCILLALAGETPLILTAGGMVEHTLRRIRSYRDEQGIPITVEQIEPHRP
ncbi:MAG: energy-coupling factor ABC transporter ATP-binding protein [Methanomicrobiales archaeon]